MSKGPGGLQVLLGLTLLLLLIELFILGGDETAPPRCASRSIETAALWHIAFICDVICS